MSKKIIIKVDERLWTGNHSFSSEFQKQETINVLRNMADLLDKETPNVKFKNLTFKKEVLVHKDIVIMLVILATVVGMLAGRFTSALQF